VPTSPNSSSPCPTGPSSGARPAGGDRRTAHASEVRPFAVLDRSFRLLVCEPAPLALDGAAVGHGLPPRPIPLDKLRGLLLHPSVDFDVRDAALSWLVGRAQADGEAWLVGLAGVLLPGVGRRVYPLCRAYPRLAQDLEAEALAGLFQAVKGWPCGQDRVATRLVWAATRAAHRLLRRELAVAEREAGVGLELEAPARPAVHGELVLEEAVAAGVVSRRDAELIAASRIEEMPVRELAQRWGVGYEALRKRRQRAEGSLADWLREQEASTAEYRGRSDGE
jgi:DNA-directed RNA polymerase specialized sigma24 family protein